MILGVGINDADYVTSYPTKCKFYVTWHSMLTRCYSLKYLDRYPTYKYVVVCKEWLLFSNFKTWMETQDWEGKQLDKDILGDGKLYSPETCCFIEQWLNKLFNGRGNSRGTNQKE